MIIRLTNDIIKRYRFYKAPIGVWCWHNSEKILFDCFSAGKYVGDIWEYSEVCLAQILSLDRYDDAFSTRIDVTDIITLPHIESNKLRLIRAEGAVFLLGLNLPISQIN